MLGKKSLLLLLASFAMAMLSGFIFASAGKSTPEAATCEFLVREMARVIKSLKPVLKAMPPEKLVSGDASVPEDLVPVVGRGLIRSLPDGDWQWKRIVTRSESLHYFARLLETLSGEMRLFPVLISVQTDFEDIVPTHWLGNSLQVLAGTGALAGFGSSRLYPDQEIKETEVRKIATSLIEYLGSNSLLVIFDGRAGKVRPKGALQEIELAGWKYSFNRKDWFELDAEGTFYPDFRTARKHRVFFEHASYVNTGSLTVEEGIHTAGMIKIQKKFKMLKESAVAATALPVSRTEDRETEKQRIRNRLLELQERYRLMQPEPLEAKKTFQEVAPAVENAESSEPPENEITETTVAADDMPEAGSSKSIPAAKKYAGQVVDALTATPVVGAVVMIGSNQLTTGNDGSFTFSADADEIVEVTAYSEGYEAITLRHRTGYREGPLKLALKPVLTSFSGKVIHSETGLPVSAVLVKIGTRATRSDANGDFSFKTVKPGYHQLSCFGKGFMEAHEIIHAGREPVENFTVKIRPVFEEYVSAGNQ